MLSISILKLDAKRLSNSLKLHMQQIYIFSEENLSEEFSEELLSLASFYHTDHKHLLYDLFCT